MTHWKKLTNPNYLGAYAFEAGEEKIVTIDFVEQEEVISTDGKSEVCIVAHLAGEKPLILNSMSVSSTS